MSHTLSLIYTDYCALGHFKHKMIHCKLGNHTIRHTKTTFQIQNTEPTTYLEFILPGYDKPTPRPKYTTQNKQNQATLQLTHNAIFNFPLPDVTACNLKFLAHFADPMPLRDIY